MHKTGVHHLLKVNKIICLRIQSYTAHRNNLLPSITSQRQRTWHLSSLVHTDTCKGSLRANTLLRSMTRLWSLFSLVFETAGRSSQTEPTSISLLCDSKNWSVVCLPCFSYFTAKKPLPTSARPLDLSSPELVQVFCMFILNASVRQDRLGRYLNHLPVYLLRTTWAAGIAFI